MLFPEITSIVAKIRGLSGDYLSGHFQVGLEVSFFCIRLSFFWLLYPSTDFLWTPFSLQGLFFGYLVVLAFISKT